MTYLDLSITQRATLERRCRSENKTMTEVLRESICVCGSAGSLEYINAMTVLSSSPYGVSGFNKAWRPSWKTRQVVRMRNGSLVIDDLNGSGQWNGERPWSPSPEDKFATDWHTEEG